MNRLEQDIEYNYIGEKLNGNIANIQRFSVHDGDGIRTIVFLKGCPLSCAWCQNPETISNDKSIMLNSLLCIGCEICCTICPFSAISCKTGIPNIDREKCRRCGKCANACPAKAIEVVGKNMTVEEVAQLIERDIPFYNTSGGGVTLSGGEPMSQPDFSRELLKRLKTRGVHTAIETNGFIKWDDFIPVLQYVDTVLYDVKHTDSSIHKQYTSLENTLILENLLKLRKTNKELIIRVPLIPYVNDSEKNLRKTAEFAVASGADEVHILPFHQMGRSKWQALGIEYSFANKEPTDTTTVLWAAQLIESYGVPVSIGGSGVCIRGDKKERIRNEAY